MCQPYNAGTASGQLCTCSTNECNGLAPGATMIARAELGISGEQHKLSHTKNYSVPYEIGRVSNFRNVDAKLNGNRIRKSGSDFILCNCCNIYNTAHKIKKMCRVPFNLNCPLSRYCSPVSAVQFLPFNPNLAWYPVLDVQFFL